MTNVRLPRASIHGMRDFNIIAGYFHTGMGFRVFGRDAFVRSRDFAFSTGPRDTKYGISHFSRDTGHGIRDFTFCTGPRDNSESRTIPRKNPGEAPEIDRV